MTRMREERESRVLPLKSSSNRRRRSFCTTTTFRRRNYTHTQTTRASYKLSNDLAKLCNLLLEPPSLERQAQAAAVCVYLLIRPTTSFYSSSFVLSLSLSLSLSVLKKSSLRLGGQNYQKLSAILLPQLRPVFTIISGGRRHTHTLTGWSKAERERLRERREIAFVVEDKVFERERKEGGGEPKETNNNSILLLYSSPSSSVELLLCTHTED